MTTIYPTDGPRVWSEINNTTWISTSKSAKFGETFLLFDIKISSASNAYEGKYLSQNIPLPNQQKILMKNNN